MNFIIGLNWNWDAIGSIASAVATIAALATIILSIKNDRDGSDEKQLAVQPWFHVSRFSRIGSNARIQLVIQNDASPNIRIEKIILKVSGINQEEELQFQYIKENTDETGKRFLVYMNADNNYFGKSACLEIQYKNLYKKEMLAISPKFNFFDKTDEASLLYIKDEKFLFEPFLNEIKK